MNLSVEVKHGEGQAILFLQGELDAFTAPKLSEHLTPLVTNPGLSKVFVDLEHLSYMDSTGIGIFIGALKSANKSGCQLVIQNAPQRIERLFSITGLHQLIPMVSGKGEKTS